MVRHPLSDIAALATEPVRVEQNHRSRSLAWALHHHAGKGPYSELRYWLRARHGQPKRCLPRLMRELCQIMLFVCRCLQSISSTPFPRP